MQDTPKAFNVRHHLQGEERQQEIASICVNGSTAGTGKTQNRQNTTKERPFY
jgi:hypothetical protein